MVYQKFITKTYPLDLWYHKLMAPQYLHELLEVAEADIPYLFKDTTAFLNLIEGYKHKKNLTRN